MKIFLIPFVFMFVGCTSVEPKYIEPSSEPTAYINFKNNSIKSLKIAYYEVSDGCQKRRHTDAILPDAEATHKIPANKQITFEFYLTNFSTSKHEQSCLLNLRFQPKAAGKYTITASEDSISCRWIATDITNPENPKLINLETVNWKSGLGEDGSFCSK